MTDYILTLGGPIEDDESDEFTRFEALDVTEGKSSMGSWTATIPLQHEFDTRIFEDVWIYYDDELIFRGELEEYEIDYESTVTTIRGRGMLVELDRRVSFAEYTETTVYDALVDYWDTLDYDALILPPNRELYDNTFISERDHRSLWTFDGTSFINTEGVTIERNRLVFNQTNTLLDDTDDDGDQASTFVTDEPTDWVAMLVVTEEPVSWLRAGLKQMENTWDYVDEEWQTIEHERPQRHHLFRFEFDSDGYEHYRPMLENGDDLIEITRSEVMAPATDGFVHIDEAVVEGTTFEVLQELHEIGSYNFAIRDYDQKAVDVFPVGTTNIEPRWRIVSSTRSKDLTDYANRVTVTGARLDDGSSYTTTAEHEDEISLMQERGVGDDGVIETYVKSTDLATEAEVEDQANRLLEEAITERDESGSLEIVPQMVMPGYSYNVSAWGDSFPYGGQIGSNSLYLDGGAGIEFSYSGTQGDQWTFEYLIHPQRLDRMADDEYYMLHEWGNPSGTTCKIRLYGDGSVELEGDIGDTARTPPNIVRNDHHQRLSITWGPGVSTSTVLINGQPRWESGDPNQILEDPYGGMNWLGIDSDGEHGYVGGLDDVRIWTSYDSVKSSDWILEHAYVDLAGTAENLEECGIYYRFNDDSDPNMAVNYGSANAPTETDGGSAAELIDVEYQDAVGQLDEVQYSLGTGDAMSLDFDISGRIDTEFVLAKRDVRRNRRAL
ncbi:hypothetical protein OB919_20000 [Halobacteria archaeon AArc-curdl1]|uniref:Uncharacterized protein n=1 Tax=Natronosalvus hydrolyticus TaxID=2979988 RepID=A0AAP2ZE14_9EURY|nr:hypothetical protein [Halobacteria archaeon AArc-curdl1]